MLNMLWDQLQGPGRGARDVGAEMGVGDEQPPEGHDPEGLRGLRGDDGVHEP